MTVHRIKARIAGEGATLSLRYKEKGGGGQAPEHHLSPPGPRGTKDWAFLSHFLNFLLFLPLPYLSAGTKTPGMT